MTASVGSYLKLMRPHHYIKNVFLFLPLLFSGRLLDWQATGITLAGFTAFCFLSSAVYILNDIADRESDRLHSEKKLRPLASGAIKGREAGFLAAALLAAGLFAHILAGRQAPRAWIYPFAYLLLNIAYSWRLKHVAILDVTILASGFLLRLAYGAALTGVVVSDWMFLTVLAMSFYLGLGKRRGELIRQAETRRVLKVYHRAFLEKSMGMCLTLTIAFYSLWAAERSLWPADGLFPAGGMLWTTPLAILICLRYSMDVEGDSDGDPVEVALHDKILCGMVILLGVAVFLLLYL